MEGRLDALCRSRPLPDRPDHDALDALCAEIVTLTLSYARAESKGGRP